MKHKIFNFRFLNLFYIFLTTINFITCSEFKNKYTNLIKLNSENTNSILLKSQKLMFGSSLELNSKNQLKSLFSLGVKSLTEIKKLNNKSRFQGLPKVTVNLNTTVGIGDGPIFYQGWNEYFILKNIKGFEMKEFFSNGAYYKEQSDKFKKKHISEKNNFIPNEKKFYFLLTSEYLNVVSSKFVFLNN